MRLKREVFKIRVVKVAITCLIAFHVATFLKTNDTKSDFYIFKDS